MLVQWSVLAIQALTTASGVGKPVAMFSPAACQVKPAAVIRSANAEPWVKLWEATILFVHPWAERSSRQDRRSAGSPRRVRCWLIRRTTAEGRATALVPASVAFAFAQAWVPWRRWDACREPCAQVGA